MIAKTAVMPTTAAPAPARPQAVTPHVIPAMMLQRALGNRGTEQVLRRCANGRPCAACAAAAAHREKEPLQIRRAPVGVQRLTVGSPDDVYEREADRVADQVMRMPAPAPELQRKCGACEEEEHKLQRKPLGAESSSAGIASGAPVPAAVHAALAGSGTPLDRATRSFFEPRFGVDFSHVRVHADQRAETAAGAVQARAFTVGSGVYFAPGEYRPDSSAGRRLLAHELTHVVQQKRRRAAGGT